MARCVVLIIIAACCWSVSAADGLARNPDSNKQNDVNFCQGCRALVAYGSKLNSTQLRDDYKEIFRNFCELYYPPSTDFQQGPCPLFVEAIFYLLNHVDPVHHCDQIGACGKQQLAVQYSLNPDISSLTVNQANRVCTFCEQTIEQLKLTLSDPRTVDQVRRQVDQLCKDLEVIDADKECRLFFDKYLDLALQFVHNIDPLAYCRSVQLCSAATSASTTHPVAKKSGASRSRVLNAQNPKRKLPTLADFNNFGIETSVLVNGKQQSREGPSCMICESVVKEMFHFLRENKTEANIVSGLNEVCQLIFSRGQSLADCQSMVHAYTKELIQLLIDETDPKMICTLIEQCLSDGQPRPSWHQTTAVKAEERTFNLGNLISSLDPTAKLKSAKVCLECKIFIKYLRSTFDEPKSRDEIKNWLVDNLCAAIPDKEVSVQCKRLIDQYADTFFAAVIGSLNPSAACSDLGACTRKNLQEVLHIDTMAPFERPNELPSLVVSPKSSFEPKAAKKVLSREQKAVTGQLCDQCVQIVTQIDEYLANHPIDKDVSSLIDNVCNKMPEGSVRSECTYLIEAFGTQIAQAIASMDNPRQLCGSIMLC